MALLQVRWLPGSPRLLADNAVNISLYCQNGENEDDDDDDDEVNPPWGEY